MELDQKIRYAMWAVTAASVVFAGPALHAGVHLGVHFGALDTGGVVDYFGYQSQG